MARRTLMLVIESEPRTCGRCRHVRWDLFKGRHECRFFGRLETPRPMDPDRHDACLAHETFAGG